MKLFSISKAIKPMQSSQTLKNLSYLLTAEGISRVARIALTVVMARLLGVSDFGTLAIALTVHELVAVLAHNGFGLKLLNVAEEDADAGANSAYVLSFFWCSGMFLLQMLLALEMPNWGYEQPGYLLQALAPLHLLLPFALTHVHMIHRRGELGSFAAVGTLQNVLECLLSLVLLLFGFDLWSIVIARFVSTLFWVVGFRRAGVWSFDKTLGFLPVRAMFEFTGAVLISEYAKSVRFWGDNLLVGALLGAEALGLYYFAKNSGLGISLSLSQISVTTVTPRLAQLARDNQSDSHAIRKRLIGRFSAFLVVCIGAQALLAPYYVPILFGSDWTPAVLLLSLLCASAIPRAIADLHAALARVSGLASYEMGWNAVYTVVFLLLVLVTAPLGLELMAVTIIGLNLIMALAISLSVWRKLAPGLLTDSQDEIPLTNPRSMQY